MPETTQKEIEELKNTYGDTRKTKIYKAALAFNSYWFADTYIDLAYYFQMAKNTPWKKVDPKEVLSAKYSSASGYYSIKDTIGTVPGAQNKGASCGA